MLGQTPKRLLCTLLIGLPMLIPGAALAAAYSLPADIGSGPFSSCSGGGPIYSCSADVSLNNNDSVSLSANVTLNISGDFDVGKNVVIDDNGFTFNVNTTGDIDIGDGAQVSANLDAVGKIEIGKNVVFNGDISAGDEIKIGDDVNFSGNIDSNDNLDIGKRFMLTGDIMAGSDVKLGDDAAIIGNITAGGKIETKKRASITGDLNAGGDIKIDKDNVINGDVTTAGNLDIGNGSVVNGNCTPNHPQCTGTPPPGGGSCETFRDAFAASSYGNQDGTLNWSADWIEVGDNGSPSGGSIRIRMGELEFRGGGSSANSLGGPYVQREADLSAYDTATLTFDYDETGNWEPSDRFEIYLSDNGGASWTLIQAFSGNFGGTPQQFSFDMTAYMAGNTRVAFVEKMDSNGERFQLDNVQIEACSSALDHFRITPATLAASTCLPNAITIVAEDAGNNPVTGYTGTVNIATSTARGNWSVNDADNVTVPNPDNDNDGAVDYTFVASDLGEIILDLANTRAESLTISVTDAAEAVTSVSAVIIFADNVFVITEDSIQVAGRPQAMSVTLWTNDAAGSGSCGPDPSYNYVHDLDVSIDRAGVLPAAIDPRIDGTPIPDGPPASASVQFDFSGGSGSAGFDLDTTDVGQYRLTVTDNTNNHSSGAISGISALLTVRPFGIGVSNIVAGATVNPGGTLPGDLRFTVAGGDFAADVAGVLWDPMDDTEGGVGDGTPDAGRVFADNTPAPSYAWDTALGVSALPMSYTPFPGTPGILNNAALLPGDFAAGQATVTDLQYTEVGSFTLQASAVDFLGDPDADIVGDDIVVGRFIPAYFDINITDDGSFAETCGVFTYLGEDFGYAVAPTFTVTAYNLLDDVTAQYRGAFVKLDGSSVVADVSQDSSNVGSDSNPLLVSYTASAMGFTANDDGTVDYSFGADSYRYGPDAPLVGFSKAANSQVAPFPADIDPEISSVSDGEVTTSFAVGTQVLDPDGNNQYFGRLRMENVHGSELNPLVMPVVTEYWNGTAFQRNLFDTCTAILDADLITVAADPPALSIPTVDSNPAAAGVINYEYPSPGDGNDGFVETRTDLDPAGPADHLWLRYDWDAGGEFDDDPSARATFGIFDGNPVQIYIQQIFQQ